MLLLLFYNGLGLLTIQTEHVGKEAALYHLGHFELGLG